MRTRSGFSLVEILMVVFIAAVLFVPLYQFLIRGYKHHDLETKNLEAIQEMAFIIYSLRSDLRMLIEFENDPETYACFNPAARTLNLTTVNGVTENGMVIYSKAVYCFEKGCLVKKFRELESKGLSDIYTRKLTGQDKLKEFEISILDANGVPLSSSRSPGQSPRYLKAKIVHATNTRLDVLINVFSTFIESRAVDEMQKYWLPTWKMSTAGQQFTKIMSNSGDFAVDFNALPNSALTGNGIRIGNNMGVSSGFGR